jgi:N-acetyl sugar amidotransferase
MKNTYCICSRCVMDTSDTKIIFDDEGVCDHCKGFDTHTKPNWHPNDQGNAMLNTMVKKIKYEGRKRDFDCIMGMSGGADSSYLLHIAVKKLGLRPLVFHVDCGWNTTAAVNNIQRMVEKLDINLFTEVVNWKEMADLQLSYFKSGVPNIDIPQDLAYTSAMYRWANKNGVKYILNGGNISTECVRNPKEWIYYGTDFRQLKDILKRFGTVDLKSFPLSNILFHKVYLRYFKRIKVVKPLDLLPYDKRKAKKILSDLYGWEGFNQKHFESRFTRFYEGYWLPTRFGIDTRRVQFSSLILTGQMSRDDALKELENLSYDPSTIDEEFRFVASKIGISEDQLRSYHEMELKSFKDYRNSEVIFDIGAYILQKFGSETAVKR